MQQNLNENKRNDNMDSELTLIKLLGLNLEKTNNPNKYLIKDNFGLEVGTIERQNQYSKPKNQGICIEEGYRTIIETDNICYNGYRIFNKTNNTKQKYFHDFSYVYNFNVKRNGQKIAKVNLNMNEQPSLSYRSRINKDSIHFYLLKDKFYLKLSKEKNNALLEETTLVEIGNRIIKPTYDVDQSYGYTKSIEAEDMAYINNIEFYHDARWWDRQGPYMKVTTQDFKNWQLISENVQQNVTGTIEDVIKNHGKGLESFNRFRKSLHKLLPFKDDLIPYFIERYENEANEFALFIPELEYGYNKDQEDVNVKALKR